MRILPNEGLVSTRIILHMSDKCDEYWDAFKQIGYARKGPPKPKKKSFPSIGKTEHQNVE